MMELSYRRHRFPPLVIQHAVCLPAVHAQLPRRRGSSRRARTSVPAIDPEGLTTDLKLVENPASRAPASQATSSRIAGRHHLGISGRLRRNLQARVQVEGALVLRSRAPSSRPWFPKVLWITD